MYQIHLTCAIFYLLKLHIIGNKNTLCREGYPLNLKVWGIKTFLFLRILVHQSNKKYSNIMSTQSFRLLIIENKCFVNLIELFHIKIER